MQVLFVFDSSHVIDTPSIRIQSRYLFWTFLFDRHPLFKLPLSLFLLWGLFEGQFFEFELLLICGLYRIDLVFVRSYVFCVFWRFDSARGLGCSWPLVRLFFAFFGLLRLQVTLLVLLPIFRSHIFFFIFFVLDRFYLILVLSQFLLFFGFPYWFIWIVDLIFCNGMFSKKLACDSPSLVDGLGIGLSFQVTARWSCFADPGLHFLKRRYWLF